MLEAGCPTTQLTQRVRHWHCPRLLGPTARSCMLLSPSYLPVYPLSSRIASAFSELQLHVLQATGELSTNFRAAGMCQPRTH